MAIAGPPSVEDSVVESSEGGCPPGMAAVGSSGGAEVLLVLVVGE